MSRPRKKKENPIHTAVGSWLDSLPPSIVDIIAQHTGCNDYNRTRQQLLDHAPKRWVVYEPMVLLPSGSFTTEPWPALLNSLNSTQKDALWRAILQELSPPSNKPPLTHLAINEGIPLHLSPTPNPSDTTPTHEEEKATQENLLRSPTGLHLLHGDFGPAHPSSQPPSESDFQAALWVSTKQNGIYQTWAPRHTMFSRGNIKEKARLLSFPTTSTTTTTTINNNNKHGNKLAIDLYAGIGYFTFSLAARGLRVLCWELNPWSVEGLRRGAVRNGWVVKVVSPRAPLLNNLHTATTATTASDDTSTTTSTVGMDLRKILTGDEQEEAPQIIVFLEDNKHARQRITTALLSLGTKMETEVVHISCGFLPSSRAVWRDAWEIAAASCQLHGQGTWLHLHENVAEDEVERRKSEVQGLFSRWASEQASQGEKRCEARMQHVELVKTFAPGVWHCVFDVFVCITKV
jgi:tRNA wybutosine-synthesizing protein 2